MGVKEGAKRQVNSFCSFFSYIVATIFLLDLHFLEATKLFLIQLWMVSEFGISEGQPSRMKLSKLVDAIENLRIEVIYEHRKVVVRSHEVAMQANEKVGRVEIPSGDRFCGTPFF